MAAWDNLIQLLHKLDQGRVEWPNEAKLVISWYSQLCAAKIDRTHERSMQQLEASSCSWDTRRDFLTNIALDPATMEADEAGENADNDCLTLSTIHSAKGREWHTVYMLNVIDGGIPSARATIDETEEERRLLYVAMTRAKRRLVLVAPKKRGALHWQPGQRPPLPAYPSHFLEGEIEREFKKANWNL